MTSLFDFQIPDELTNWIIWIYLIQALFFLWLGSRIYATVRKVNLAHELTQKDNPALAISYGGFLAALAIVVASVIQAPSPLDLTWQREFLSATYWTAGSLILLLGTLFINDFVMFPRFQNRKEILEDRNTGLASVEAAAFISTALLFRASLTEQITPVDLGEPWLTLLYFGIGQALFLLYSKIYPKVARLELSSELRKDNPAVGISFAGSLTAFAILLATAKTRYDSLPTLILLALAYVVVLSLFRFAIHLLFSGKVSLAKELQTDRNWGLGILEAVISLAIAFILVASL